MKKIRLILGLLLLSFSGLSQTCPDVVLGDIVSVTPGTYQLLIMYTATGQNHIVDSIFCGNTLLSTECVNVTGPGLLTRTINCPGNTPSAILNIGTGVCGTNTLCNRIFICPSCGPLPVTLTQFVAQRKNGDVLLTWTTETELNSSHFDIYRSYDDINYEKIGSVNNAAANSNIPHDYSFTEANASSLLTYYKLKIVDIDDRFKYSDVKTVRGTNSGNINFTVFPNPVSSNSNITISGINEPTQIQIIDNAGRILKSVTITSNSLDLSGIQRGNYILMIKGKSTGQTTVRKLSIVN